MPSSATWPNQILFFCCRFQSSLRDHHFFFTIDLIIAVRHLVSSSLLTFFCLLASPGFDRPHSFNHHNHYCFRQRSTRWLIHSPLFGLYLHLFLHTRSSPSNKPRSRPDNTFCVPVLSTRLPPSSFSSSSYATHAHRLNFIRFTTPTYSSHFALVVLLLRSSCALDPTPRSRGSPFKRLPNARLNCRSTCLSFPLSRSLSG